MNSPNERGQPDCFVASKEEPWRTISKIKGLSNIIYRMCRTPDCKQVVGGWMMYEDVNAKFDITKGWTIPENPDPPRYEIRNFPGKGHGMVARRKIEAGELIVQERPVIVAPMQLHSASPDRSESELGFERGLLQLLYWLEPDDRKAVLELHNCKPPSECGLLFGILRTNGIGTRYDDSQMAQIYNCLTLKISMANHSCSPNSRYYVDTRNLMVRLHADRDIAPGQEITISYCDAFAPRAVRQESLLRDYDFTCECPSCSCPPSNIAQSDARRELIKTTINMDLKSLCEAWITIRGPGKSDSDRMELVDRLSSTLDAMEKEGFGLHTYRFDLVSRLAQMYAALGEAKQFQMFAAQVVKGLWHSTHERVKWSNWLYKPSSCRIGGRGADFIYV